MRLSTPAPLLELLMLALDEEERMGRWSESDGPKDQIAQVEIVIFSCVLSFFHSKRSETLSRTMANGMKI